MSSHKNGETPPTMLQKMLQKFFLRKTNKKRSYELRIFNAIIRRIFGATDPIRTDDLLITSELLYRLSHSSTLHSCNVMYSIINSKNCQGFFDNREKHKKLRMQVSFL